MRELRRGWTTGACAAAAARSAWCALTTGAFEDPVTIRLPRGECPSFPLAERRLEPGRATAGVIKDAGDDPDVTHGALVLATVEPAPAGSGIAFRAGPGVGTVTLPGLPLAPGEPAINPAPRALIRDMLGPVDATVTIAIPGGEALAAKTMNGRLGILGGLSVLGTTGIVVPYSCSAWIHSIHRGVDVARAAGLDHLGAATGSTSEAAVRRLHHLPELALIDMGDFAGALLKYLRRYPVRRLSLGGGFAKLAKLGQGRLDLHSARSRLDVAALAAEAGLPPGGSDTGGQLLAEAGERAPALARLVAERARATALATLAGDTAVDVAVFDRAGMLLAQAGP